MLSDPKNNSLSLSMVEKKGNLLDQFHNFLYLYIGPRFKDNGIPLQVYSNYPVHSTLYTSTQGVKGQSLVPRMLSVRSIDIYLMAIRDPA